ncbi:uncharacterized protein LOC132187811 [Corylus avellana]|uniref:uncharacterized protein LOC132187811 n=1 Tax=Corylus avellana TaxID=13451 RepID=UPI00286C2235|nr:uncharacterized protein LOC132187811 [Corylus avellana]
MGIRRSNKNHSHHSDAPNHQGDSRHHQHNNDQGKNGHTKCNARENACRDKNSRKMAKPRRNQPTTEDHNQSAAAPQSEDAQLQGEDLARIFLTHFLGSRERKKPSGYLLTLHQQERESLKEFMVQFNAVKLKVEDPNDCVIFFAIYNGISPDEPVARKIARRQPSNLHKQLDKVEEFINEKETLKAMKSARKLPKKFEDKKKKDLQRLDDPGPFKKKFKGYNFTLLNAIIFEVLMEVKRDLEYEKPPRMPKVPQRQNSNRYCEFHKANGHYTEGYIALRHLIENFIKNGGFDGGGESGRARKAYAQQVGSSHEIYTIGRSMKQSRTNAMLIGFSDNDYACISFLHMDALIVTLTVVNYNVHRILVDNGSSADILYWFAFKKLNLG